MACDPFIEEAVHRVLQIKDRTVSKGLIVIADRASKFQPELDKLEEDQRQLVEKSWPGAISWILPTDRFPPWVRGDFPTIAARVPDHVQARSLVKTFGGPLISTSANKTGNEPCKTEDEVRMQLGELVDFVLSGTIGVNSGPSRILDARTGQQIR